MLHTLSRDAQKPYTQNVWMGGYGTRQLTVLNTCLVNAYDVLKPPGMAATVAYSNPMRRRPIVVVYTVDYLYASAVVNYEVGSVVKCDDVPNFSAHCNIYRLPSGTQVSHYRYTTGIFYTGILISPYCNTPIVFLEPRCNKQR